MKQQIATTREQSDRLLQCGVPAGSADMMITPHNTLSTNPYKSVFRDRGHSPAWSLSALLGLLPKEIDIDGYKYRISIYFENPDEPVIGNQWCLYYKPKKHNEKSRIDDVPMYAPDPIEACVQLIEWLTANGYQLNVIEKGAIDRLSIAFGECRDAIRREAEAIGRMAEDMERLNEAFGKIKALAKSQPRQVRKSYVSPYAKFDKIRKQRHGK